VAKNYNNSVMRIKRITKKVRAAWAEECEAEAEALAARPKTRAECVSGPRPCPWVGCRYHLQLDVRQSGAIWGAERECGVTCALDVADHDELTLAQIAKLLGYTYSRVQQIYEAALQKLREMEPWDK
jgi:hypothetical protein